jgi:hypothetical protein
MARIYYKNANGDYIRGADGKYMTGEPTMPGHPCCCSGEVVTCADCGLGSSNTFEVTVPGHGVYITDSYSPTCFWSVSPLEEWCGGICSIAVWYTSGQWRCNVTIRGETENCFVSGNCGFTYLFFPHSCSINKTAEDFTVACAAYPASTPACIVPPAPPTVRLYS